MPLAGGVTQAPENPYTLPGNFYTVGQSGSPDALLRRSFDGGSTFGAAPRSAPAGATSTGRSR